MSKRRKRPRGTRMGDISCEMRNIVDDPNLSESSTRIQQQIQSQLTSKSFSQSLKQSSIQLHSVAASRTGSSDINQPITKKGRGPTKLPDEWDSGVNIQVTLNEEGQVIGAQEQYNKFSSALGALARIGTLLPLDYERWSDIPQNKFDTLWNDVEVNTTLPPEAKKIVLRNLNDMWRDWKHRLKAEYFIPYKDDPHHDFSKLPTEQVELDQWLELVRHWKRPKVQEMSEKNSANRANKKYLHRTGKIPFQLLKENMKSEGKDTTKLDVFVESRTRGKGLNVDEATANLIQGIERELGKRSKSEQTKEFKEELFINALGEDLNGRVRCTGRGITRKKLDDISNAPTSQIIEQMHELQQLKDELAREKVEIEQVKEELNNQKNELSKHKAHAINEVRSEFREELDHMKLSLDFFVSLVDPATLQAALSRINPLGGQVATTYGTKLGAQVNADEDSTLHFQQQSCSISKSKMDHEKVSTEKVNQMDMYYSNLVQVGSDVTLFCDGIPKEVVAIGVILSMNPKEEIDKVALGCEFVKVAIKKAIVPKYCLPRPCKGMKTVGQAVGKSVAWQICNVLEK